jgi:general secretion pathway protein F
MPGGKVATGVIEACNESAAITAIRLNGGLVAGVEVARTQSAFLNDVMLFDVFGNKLNSREIAHFTSELSIMLDAGQDLDRVLHSLVNKSKSARARNIIAEIRDAVRDGSSLASALALHPESFPRLYIGLVRAAETGGVLNTTFGRLSNFLDRQRTLRSVIITALIYPAILLLAAIITVVLLLDLVLPQFAPLFEDAGATLPLATRVLLLVANLLQSYGLASGCLLVFAFFCGLQALKLPKARSLWDRFLLRIPVVGSLIRELIAARFSRCLGTLLESGVPLINALGITCEVLQNSAAVNAVKLTIEGAKGGAGLFQPLQSSNTFPERLIDLLRLGEETAQLARLTLRAAEIHEEQTRIAFERLTQLLTPVLLLVIALIISGIVGSVLVAILAVYDLPS